jgi:pimeloyl-ACP methyl ester carboxylesterase
MVTFTLSPAAEALAPTIGPKIGEVRANGITIAYESFGDPNSEAILLIPGVGMQLTGWPIELVEELVKRGYHVIRFDNRDIGLSTKFTEAGLPDAEAIQAALAAGEAAPMPYTLRDMGNDVVGLMDALAIPQAHIVGVSMGANIGQYVAIDHPERVLSLTLIGADSGNPALPVIARPEAFEGVPPQPTTVDKDTFVEWQVKTWQALAGSAYPTGEAILRERAQLDFERNFDPEAMTRQQTVSLLGHYEPDNYRLNNLQNISAPTVILHGSEDPLVPIAAAEDIASRVPNAELRIIPGLGHFVPVALVTDFADAITGVAM